MAKKNLFDEEDDEPQQEVKQNKNKNKSKQQASNDQEDNSNVKLKINKNFAQQFEKRVQRQLVDKAKAIYGTDYEKKMEEERNDDDESSNLEEDSDGELLNEKVNEKFIETLAKIRQKDPSIYKSDKTFFKEKDFKISEKQQKSSNKNEKMTYRDMIRKQALEKMDQEDFSSDEEEDQNVKGKGKGETIADEQKRLKDEFKKAALKQDQDEDDEEDDGDDDADKIFTQKKKTLQQIENENKEYEKFMDKMKKKKSKKGKEEDLQVLQSFWGDETKLDDTDKFLRKFIMTKGWVDRDEMAKDEDFEDADLEQEDEADRYEAKYNFRYEEPTANEVTTYGRKVEDSLRQKDSKRADKRKEREDRKKEEKKQFDEEMKQIKSATKSAILERIHKIQEISGTKKIKADINKLLEEDFDDEKFTKQLQKQFDSDYYEEEDSDIDELKDYEKSMKKQEKKEQIMELEKLGLDKQQIQKMQKKIKKAVKNDDEIEEEDEEDVQENGNDKQSDDESEWSDEDEIEEEVNQNNKGNADEDKDNVLNIKSNIPLAMKKNLKDSEIQAMNQNDKGEDGLYLWWYCDNCKKGIQPAQHRFDCQECPDYTLCKICNEGQFHEHTLKKIIVPKNCVPPSDKEILKLLEVYQVCKKCNLKLDEYCSYYKLKSNEEVVLCDECYDVENYQGKKLYEFVEASKVDLEALAEQDPQKLKKYITDEDIQNLVDQYYNLDYEDVITGGMKTRFKYIDVQPEAYGLSDEQLLYADTDSLNKYVSIKKFAPYREDEGKVKSKLLKNKKYLKLVEKSTKLNKKIIKKDTEKGLTTKEDLKELKKKDKKKYLKQMEKLKKEKQQKKEEVEQEKPKLVIEDLTKQERAPEVKISNNRKKAYGF